MLPITCFVKSYARLRISTMSLVSPGCPESSSVAGWPAHQVTGPRPGSLLEIVHQPTKGRGVWLALLGMPGSPSASLPLMFSKPLCGQPKLEGERDGHGGHGRRERSAYMKGGGGDPNAKGRCQGQPKSGGRKGG